MKQILLERQGYSERIERMFGKGMVVALLTSSLKKHLFLTD